MPLTWLPTVSSTFQDLDFDGHINHFSSVDIAIMVSKNCPISGEHIVIIIVT